MRLSSAVSFVAVVGVLVASAGQSGAQSTRRPLIPGLPSLPPMLQGLSLSSLPGISHIMNMPLPFNVPFSLSSLPPLRLPIRFPTFLGGAGMIRNATHLIRNTFLSSPSSASSSSISTSPLTSSGGSSSGSALGSSLGSSLSSSLSSSLGSSLNSNSLSQMLSPLLPLLNFGSNSPLAVNRNGVIDAASYAPYFRALQLRSAHERRRRSIVHQMLRQYQPINQPIAPAAVQIPLEQLAQFRAYYGYH